MNGIRRQLGFVAVMWLLSHAVTVAMGLTALCCPPASASGVSSDEDECCKGLAPGQMCPLHKHGAHAKKPVPAKPDGRCALRSGCSQESIGVAAVTLDLALLPENVSLTNDATSAVVTGVDLAPRVLHVLPDLPPPRA